MKSTVRAARSGHERRRRPLVAVMAVGLATVLTVSGCAAGQVSQTANQVSAIDGANATVGEIGIRNALLATPDGPKWAAGSDVGLQFWLTNDGSLTDTLTQVSSTGATSVEISGKAAVEGQSRIQFGADSKVTVTVKGLTADLTYGQTLPMTFVFATAGQVTTNVPVQVPDERTGERQTIDILPPEHHSVYSEMEQAPPAEPSGDVVVGGAGTSVSPTAPSGSVATSATGASTSGG